VEDREEVLEKTYLPSEHCFMTEELSIACYLLCEKIKLVQVTVDKNRSGSGNPYSANFYFDNTDNSVQDKLLEYQNSKEREFDQNMRYLKTLAKGANNDNKNKHYSRR